MQSASQSSGVFARRHGREEDESKLQDARVYCKLRTTLRPIHNLSTASQTATSCSPHAITTAITTAVHVGSIATAPLLAALLFDVIPGKTLPTRSAPIRRKLRAQGLLTLVGRSARYSWTRRRSSLGRGTWTSDLWAPRSRSIPSRCKSGSARSQRTIRVASAMSQTTRGTLKKSAPRQKSCTSGPPTPLQTPTNSSPDLRVSSRSSG